jgi:hypothetical protein
VRFAIRRISRASTRRIPARTTVGVPAGIGESLRKTFTIRLR